jgi:hypothetical protein
MVIIESFLTGVRVKIVKVFSNNARARLVVCDIAIILRYSAAAIRFDDDLAGSQYTYAYTVSFEQRPARDQT